MKAGTAVAVGIVALVAVAAFAVLARSGGAPTASSGADVHSRSAVGFAAAAALLKAEGVGVRTGADGDFGEETELSVLTPGLDEAPLEFVDKPGGKLLVVLPKWSSAPDRKHAGWRLRVGLEQAGLIEPLLSKLAPGTRLLRREAGDPHLSVVDGGGEHPIVVDRLQVLVGKGWSPLLVTPDGGVVAASPAGRGEVVVLADPDLLNTQGLRSLDNARVGLGLIDSLRGGKGVGFIDKPLAAKAQSPDALPAFFRPPMLGATLCALAAALLMGAQALVRFGPAAKEGRAVALGATALVESSAGLVKMARKEHQIAPAYVELTEAAVARVAGIERAEGTTRERLDALGRRHGATAALGDLWFEAAHAANRSDLMKVARKIYGWRQEMTRDRR